MILQLHLQLAPNIEIILIFKTCCWQELIDSSDYAFWQHWLSTPQRLHRHYAATAICTHANPLVYDLLNKALTLKTYPFVQVICVVLCQSHTMWTFMGSTYLSVPHLVAGDSKAPFSIAITPRCRGGRYSIPWIAPLYPWSVPYSAEYLARWHQEQFFLSLWYDLTWDWTLVSQIIGKHSTH